MIIYYDDFEFEVDNYDDKVKEIIEELYNIKVTNELWALLTDMDIDFEEKFYDQLKDYFEDEAMEQKAECEAYNNDQYGYNGVSRKDFY